MKVTIIYKQMYHIITYIHTCVHFVCTLDIAMATTGFIVFPTQTTHYQGSPSKLAYICIVSFPENRSFTLPKFNSSPLKRYRGPIGKDRLPGCTILSLHHVKSQFHLVPPFCLGLILQWCCRRRMLNLGKVCKQVLLAILRNLGKQSHRSYVERSFFLVFQVWRLALIEGQISQPWFFNGLSDRFPQQVVGRQHITPPNWQGL